MPRKESLYPADWLRIAEKDFARVDYLLREKDAEAARFFLQQAIEFLSSSIQITYKFSFLLATILISFSFIDCSDAGVDAVYTDEAGLEIHMAYSSMSITNSTADTVRFFAVEQEASTLIDWMPQCGNFNLVKPRSTKEVPYSKIQGYHDQCEIRFYWWHCALNNSGRMEPVSLRRLNLKSP